MKVNTELAARIYRQITMHPETHRQYAVAEGVDVTEEGNICGTTACVAGWACAYAGHLVEIASPLGNYAWSVDWFWEGKDALGISSGLAEALFNSELPEDHARAAVGLLATSGGSEEEAMEYLSSRGFVF